MSNSLGCCLATGGSLGLRPRDRPAWPFPNINGEQYGIPDHRELVFVQLLNPASNQKYKRFILLKTMTGGLKI